ncbi:MAG: hypothetical protein ACOX6T_08450 [Myxococcales bacterium]
MIAVALAVGAAACPTGGTEIRSAYGATYACNGTAGPQGPKGDPGMTGPQGPAGPRVLLKDGNGAVLGQAFPSSPFADGGAAAVGVYLAEENRFLLVDPHTGRSVIAGPTTYFDRSDCTGRPFFIVNTGALYALDVGGRLFVQVATGAPSNAFLESYLIADGTCVAQSRGRPAYLAEEVSSTDYPLPLPLPLTLAFE